MTINQWRPMGAATVALACGLLATSAFAQRSGGPGTPAAQADEPYESVPELLNVLRQSQGSSLSEEARVRLSSEGHVRFLGTPPMTSIPVADPALSPDAIASGFLRRSRKLIGADDPAAGFVVLKTKDRSTGRTVVKLQQTYSGIPVFGSSAIVQLAADRGVESLITDIEHDLTGLRGAALSRNAVLPAQTVVVSAVKSLGGGKPLETTEPELLIFSPQVLGVPGEPILVWLFETIADEPGYGRRFLIDAVSGEIVRNYPLAYDALDRRIYDSNTSGAIGTLVRSEGQGPAAVADANFAYAFLGDTYSFYSVRHARDSVDGAGLVLSASVRHCYQDQTGYPFGCPMANAFWFSNRMWFGAGFATDDVTGHEVTHGVTEYESGLKYENHSGAINESFSDVWGEFIDLGNGAGNDASGARWLIGEDLSGGALRSMQNPPLYGHPDRMGSPFFVPTTTNPTSGNDYGGVHTNSGVNNKLTYLLTDGDEFNGQSTFGMGIAKVADLYYEAQVNLLMPFSDYADLNVILQQAAVNLGWSHADRENVYRGCVAVEIETTGNIYVNTLNNTGAENGTSTYPFNTVGEGVVALSSDAHLTLNAGTYDEAVTISVPSILTSVAGTTQIGALNGANACADAVEIINAGTISFDNTLATMDGEPACDEGFGAQIDHDIWYLWTPDTSQSYSVSTCGQTTVDTKIAVYAGTTCGSTTPVACNDDTAGCNFQSVATFNAVGGTPYLIRIGTYAGDGGEPGAGTFSILP